jgi:hypothetical protein
LEVDFWPRVAEMCKICLTPRAVNPFKKRAIEAQALAAKVCLIFLTESYLFSRDSSLQPADLMAILNGRSKPAQAASAKAAPVAKGKGTKVSGKV